MYHERTYREIAQTRRRRIITVVAVAVLAVALALAVAAGQRASRQQAVESVRDAVVTAAQQCAAVEGSYPSTLSYLEAEYGLTINHDDYLVYYEWLGDNVPPSVVVRAR